MMLIGSVTGARVEVVPDDLWERWLRRHLLPNDAATPGGSMVPAERHPPA